MTTNISPIEINVEAGAVTLTLNVLQCATLARACEAAKVNSQSDTEYTDLHSLALLFKMTAAAAVNQSYMQPQQQQNAPQQNAPPTTTQQ